MKLGVHTIAWGENCGDFLQLLSDVRTTGFTGIELFQHPDQLNFKRDGLWAKNFDKALSEESQGKGDKIHLVGVCFGTFRERRDFVSSLALFRNVPLNDHALPYIYTDEWGSDEAAALADGLRIAIHPHMFQQIQTMKEAEAILATNPTCLFLPDTAHLTIAGDEPSVAINTILKESPSKNARIPAVHLKDWKSNVGRSYQFYARGLCNLGEGKVKLLSTLEVLVKRRYDGWLIVEQDRTTDPKRTAAISMAWLRANLPAHPRHQ